MILEIDTDVTNLAEGKREIAVEEEEIGGEMSLVARNLGATDKLSPNIEALPGLVVLEDIELNETVIDSVFTFPVLQFDELTSSVVEASDASSGDGDVVIVV